MRHFLETTFGPHDLKMVQAVLREWQERHGFEPSSPEVDIAAAVILNMYREGHRSAEKLTFELAKHKGLAELATSSFTSSPGRPASP